jgi:flavin reductase (DIM6/NTAB) family NADH-FMN oxidoreductase RutF
MHPVYVRFAENESDEMEEAAVTKREVSYTYQLDRTLDKLAHGGLLLAATRSGGRSNAMVIGWGTIGVIWGVPVWVVLVRPSRYTYSMIEESGFFTVNVPTPEMKELVTVCGTRSGRDVDKLARVETSMGNTVACVTLDACPVVYECKVVHSNDVLPATLMPDIASRAYPQGDFHRLYYGQIMGTFAE